MAMLSGIKVLDLSRLLPGPFATWLMQAHGAEVTKLEEPRGGDYLRWLPPFDGQLGAMFTALNRGKRSLTLDLRAEAGQAAFRSLLPHFDVVLESFRPGVLARFGLDFEQLGEDHPELILASLTGFGKGGPWAGMPGHDVNFQGMAGTMAAASRPDGVPHLSALPVADLMGGTLMAAFTISAALLQRERTGRGCFLDLSMTDGAATMVYPFLATELAAAKPPPPGEDLLTGGNPCYGVYRCGDDRLITVASLEPRFLAILQRECALGPGVPGRAQLEAIFATAPREHWVERLADACIGPLLELDELLDDSLVASRGVLGMGARGLWACPPGGAPATGAPPRLGEHSRLVVEAAGLDFEALLEAGVSSEPG
jgi:alpha-methylacyl-CoA racemase